MTRAVLIVTTAIFVLSLGPWLITALFSVMFFDAPGSTEMLFPWLMFCYVWLYPLFVIPPAIISWILHSQGKFRFAVMVGLTPLFYILPGILWFIISIFFMH